MSGQEKLLEETRSVTDAEGRYGFTVSEEQSRTRDLYLELRVEHPDYASRTHFDGALGYPFSWVVDKQKKGGRQFFERVQLLPGKAVTGVVERPDGKPAAGVRVAAFSSPPDGNGHSDFEAWSETKTDADGRFRLVATTPGRAVFWVLPRDLAPTRYVLKDGERGDVGRITLQPGQVLTGRVLDRDGRPVAGVYVNATNSGPDPALEPLHIADVSGRTALTDARGEFTMRPLEAGHYDIQPGERPYEHADEWASMRPRPVPGVFLAQTVTVREGVEARLTVRAAKQVVVETRWVDTKGKPGRAYEFHLTGQIDAERRWFGPNPPARHWFGTGRLGKAGVVTAVAPQGLNDARLRIMCGPQFALRWRMTKADPLRIGSTINLGTLSDDVKGIEVIQYKAPVLSVKVKAKDGAALKDVVVTADYVDGADEGLDRYILGRGLQSHLIFQTQDDGRFHSQRLLPDEEIVVTAHVEGYHDASVKVKLAEGERADAVLTVEKK